MNSLEISIHDAQALLDAPNPPRLIDVREKDEFDFCKMKGAELLPLSTFMQDYAAMLPDRAQKILLYCHHGMRSLRAAEFLSQAGYQDAKSITGGIDLWSVEIDSSIPRY